MWRMNICVFIHQLPLLTGRECPEGIKTQFQAVSVYVLIWSLASEDTEVESTDIAYWGQTLSAWVYTSRHLSKASAAGTGSE